MTSQPTLYIGRDEKQRVEWNGVQYLAAFLASDSCPPHLAHVAVAEVLYCTECNGGPYSAVDLYADAIVPGECANCNAQFVNAVEVLPECATCA